MIEKTSDGRIFGTENIIKDELGRPDGFIKYSEEKFVDLITKYRSQRVTIHEWDKLICDLRTENSKLKEDIARLECEAQDRALQNIMIPGPGSIYYQTAFPGLMNLEERVKALEFKQLEFVECHLCHHVILRLSAYTSDAWYFCQECFETKKLP